MDNDSSTADPPQHPICSLPPELVEVIFSTLDMKDLLNAYYSCRHFHSLVHGSPILRSKLFLQKPSASQGRLEWDFRPHRRLLRDGGRGLPQFVPNGSPAIRPLLLNPMLFRSSDRREGVFWRNDEMIGISRIIHRHFEFVCSEAPVFGVINPNTRRLSKAALSRRMFFTQPPVTVVEVRESIFEANRRYSNWERRRYRIWNRNGVTLGDVLECLGDTMGSLNEIYFPGELVVTMETQNAMQNAVEAAKSPASPATITALPSEQQEEELPGITSDWRVLRQRALSSRK